MPILKFYRDGNGYHCNFFTQDQQYLLYRDTFCRNHEWMVFKRDPLGDSLGMKNYSRVLAQHSFLRRLDAMKAIQENYYPQWKLQKKLIKKEN